MHWSKSRVFLLIVGFLHLVDDLSEVIRRFLSELANVIIELLRHGSLDNFDLPCGALIVVKVRLQLLKHLYLSFVGATTGNRIAQIVLEHQVPAGFLHGVNVHFKIILILMKLPHLIIQLPNLAILFVFIVDILHRWALEAPLG